VCIEVLFQLAVFFLSMQEIVSSHIFLAVFFHSIYVSKQFCLITCSGMVIPPKVLLFLANQILYSNLSLCLYGSVLGLEMTMQYSYQFVGSLTIVIVSRIEMHAGIWITCGLSFWHCPRWCWLIHFMPKTFTIDIHCCIVHLTQRKFGCVPILCKNF